MVTCAHGQNLDRVTRAHHSAQRPVGWRLTRPREPSQTITRRAAQTLITSDALPQPFKAGQLLLLCRSLRLDIDMNPVNWRSPRVRANSFHGLQSLDTTQTDRLWRGPVMDCRAPESLALRRMVQALWRSAVAYCSRGGQSVGRSSRRTLLRSVSAASPPERH